MLLLQKPRKLAFLEFYFSPCVAGFQLKGMEINQGKLWFVVLHLCFSNIAGSHFGGKCHRRQIKHETRSHVGLNMKGCDVNTEPKERAEEQRKKNTHTQIMRSR